jgi:dipeptidyl-peptidase-4
LKGREGSLVQDLWEFHLQDKEHRILFRAEALGGGAVEGKVSHEEELRRARLRELGEGLTNYQWASKASTLLLPVSGDLFVWSGEDVVRATDTPEAEMGGQLSADGKALTFVRKGQVFAMKAPFEPGSEVALSPPSEGTLSYGQAEFIAQEEFGRMEGVWVSPGGEKVLYTEVNESAVSRFPIIHQGGDPWGTPRVEEHRYPFAGEANATVSLYQTDLEGGDATPISIPGLKEGYLLSIQWIPKTSHFVALVMDREQQHFRAWEVGEPGSPTLLVEERSDTWIDRPGPLSFVTNAEGEVTGFLRIDGSSGWRRIRLHSREGKPLGYVTPPGSHTDTIAWVGGDAGIVAFEGTLDNPRHRHVYSVSLKVATADGTPFPENVVTSLTGERGTHRSIFQGRGQAFLHFGSHLEEPASVHLRDGTGQAIATLHAPDWKEAKALGLVAPKPFDVTLEDGTVLLGHLYEPSGEKPDGGWPAILAPYGGPTHQMVRDTWGITAYLRLQYLSRQGFVVLSLDNRGTPRRGKGFSHVHYRALGTVEVEDQVAAVQALIKDREVNPDRVGIMGWSYGGYLAAMSLAKAPGVFRAALAGAPVTDWRGYDTGYTERYMGTPQDNLKGYEEGSVLTHLKGVRGRMLVIHGMIDENVHFRHSASLLEGLLREGKQHRVVVYPEARHAPRRVDEKRFVFEATVDWFKDALSPR